MADIAIRGVRKSYGKVEVVHGVDLAIEDGSFVVILGPSGCGKSTLLRMIAGLEAISDGEIAIGGRRVNDVEPRHRGCAMVFQNYALYPHMSVAENIGYALKVAGVARAVRRGRVEAVARIVGLGDFLDRRPGQLSGGQRQRVAMARGMIREPEVFLFDEPLSNLDATLRVQMRLEIRRLHQRLKTTSVFVTHDQIEAMTLADTLVVMNAGRIEQVGAPMAVYRRPATRFVAKFLGSPSMNIVRGRPGAEPGTVVFGSGRVLGLDGLLPAGHAGPLEVGIRPEDVLVAPPGAPNAVPFEIDLVEELGVGRLAHGRFEDTEFVVHLGSNQQVPDSGLLDVSLPPGALHLFDFESGRRIERGTAPLAIAAE